jgi:GNAT superfamily N-acetyltransferase
MASPSVTEMTPADQAAATQTIVLAFAADPMARWTWPSAHQYLEAMPRMVRAFAGEGFSLGTAWCTDGYGAAAMWLPPGAHSDEDGLGAVIDSTVDKALRAETDPIFERMAEYHPTEPHWYLPLIGADPARQGEGLGEALMAHALDRVDRDHAPAYLESSNPRNIPFYQRHGFEILGEIQVGSSPTLVPMLRPPR